MVMVCVCLHSLHGLHIDVHAHTRHTLVLARLAHQVLSKVGMATWEAGAVRNGLGVGVRWGGVVCGRAYLSPSGSHKHFYTLTHSLLPTYTDADTHRHTYTNSHTNTHMHTHQDTHTCTHSHTHIHTPRHTHMHTLTHTYTHQDTHTCTHSHTHMHTHANTHTSNHRCRHTHTHARKQAYTHPYFFTFLKEAHKTAWKMSHELVDSKFPCFKARSTVELDESLPGSGNAEWGRSERGRRLAQAPPPPNPKTHRT
jgi:hypothetical protein